MKKNKLKIALVSFCFLWVLVLDALIPVAAQTPVAAQVQSGAWDVNEAKSLPANTPVPEPTQTSNAFQGEGVQPGYPANTEPTVSVGQPDP